MITVMVADPLPATGAVAGAGEGGRGGGVVVVGDSSSTVTTRLWACGGGCGWESGWMATAAPTPPIVNSSAATRPSAAPPFPNTVLPPWTTILRGTGSLTDRRNPANLRPDDWPDRWPNFGAMPPMTASDGRHAWPARATPCRHF